MRFHALPPALILALALALSACAAVAPDAPALLPQAEIVARTTGAADGTRGQQAAAELAARAAQLRARAVALRHQGITGAEYDDLLRRARALEAQQG